MKLSEYKNEAALDLLADIIEPATEIMADKEVYAVFQSNGKKMTAIKAAIKNHKSAVIEILAALDGVPVEDYECNVFTLPAKLVEILNDKELIEFFTLQGQTEGAKSSGSATENTVAEEQ